MEYVAVKFISTHTSDIKEIKKRGYWTHGTRAAQLKVGDKVYIVPNAKELEAGRTLCAVGTATSLPTEVPAQVWSSTDSNTHQYVQQVSLKNIKYIDYKDLPPVVVSKENRAGQNGIRYVR